MCLTIPGFYLFIGDTGVNLRRFDIGVSQHLRHGFDGNAFTQRHRGKCMAGHVENIVHLRIWKNIENKPVTD